MPARIMGPTIADALYKAGVVPENCRRVELDVTVNQPPIVRYEVYLDTDLAEKIAGALTPDTPPDGS